MRVQGNIHRKRERGQTLALVAISMVSLLAMAGLSIDVVSLYVARTEAQRAANAAALAGAQMIASSGITSQPSAFTSTGQVCTSGGPGTTAAANRVAEAAARNNQIAGVNAAVDAITCDFSRDGNPEISVTVVRTGVPSFFARIWGRGASTVRASATAEAYNPSGAGGGSAVMQVTGAKPFLVPNCDPTNSSPLLQCLLAPHFVDPATGAIQNSGSFIGKKLRFRRISAALTLPVVLATSTDMPFYSLNVPANPPALVCPATTDPNCDNVDSSPGNIPDTYEANVACSSTHVFKCGDTVNVAPDAGLEQATREGGRCLIHENQNQDFVGNGNGQDGYTSLTPPEGLPLRIDGGRNNPNPALQNRNGISRSDSVVTVPLYNGPDLCVAGFPCNPGTIAGFMQLGIESTVLTPPATDKEFDAFILNVSGCGAASGNPVTTTGGSAVAVRLISQ